MFKFLQNTFIIFILISSSLFIGHFIDLNINTKNVSHNSDIVFIGHSNLQYALNDSLISKKLNSKCRNYGSGGQSLFWTIISAKKHKSQGINNFIISLDEVSYTSGSKTYNSSSGMLNMRQYKSFLNLNDWSAIMKMDLVFGIKSLFILPKFTSNFLGRYSRGERPFIDDLTKNNRGKIIDIDDKILHDFIKNNPNSNFVIVKTPFHPNYYNKIMYKKTSEYVSNRLNSFKIYENTLVLDYGKFLKQDLFFMDHSHLNYRGSNILSNEITTRLIQTEFFSKNYDQK